MIVTEEYRDGWLAGFKDFSPEDSDSTYFEPGDDWELGFESGWLAARSGATEDSVPSVGSPIN